MTTRKAIESDTAFKEKVANEDESSSACRLRTLRTQLGLSQRELALEFGVSPGAIALWETEQRPIPGPVQRLMDVYSAECTPSACHRVVPIDADWMPKKVRGVQLLAGWYLWRILGSSRTDNPLKIKVRDTLSRHLTKKIASLKGMSMKLSHMAGFMDGGMPDAQRDGFTLAGQNVPAASPSQVASYFVESFATTPRQLFVDWHPVPFSCGSIGQVHKATSKDNQKLAIKVQYPQMREILRAELKDADIVDALYRRRFPGQVDPLFTAIARHFLAECDYGLEAQATMKFRELFEDVPYSRFPQVYLRYSNARVLTMSLESGDHLFDFASQAESDTKNISGTVIWRVNWTSILKHGLCNTDPNPGNYLFSSDGTVTFIDFGRVQSFSSDYIHKWKLVLRSVLERDLFALKHGLIAMGYASNPELFDFSAAYVVLLHFYRPVLCDVPFAFTPGHIEKIWRVWSQENPNLNFSNHSAELAFSSQLTLGVDSILARLEATVECRPMMLELLYEAGEDIPPPFSPEELSGYGLV